MKIKDLSLIKHTGNYSSKYCIEYSDGTKVPSYRREDVSGKVVWSQFHPNLGRIELDAKLSAELEQFLVDF